MTTPTPVRPGPPAARTVTVAVLGPAAPPAADLGAALGAVRLGRVAWRVLAGETATGRVDVVVCGGLAPVATAVERWPAAAVVALVPPRHRGPADDVPHAAGVLLLTEGDVGLVAAYVQSIARRRGLVAASADAGTDAGTDAGR